MEQQSATVSSNQLSGDRTPGRPVCCGGPTINLCIIYSAFPKKTPYGIIVGQCVGIRPATTNLSRPPNLSVKEHCTVVDMYQGLAFSV